MKTKQHDERTPLVERLSSKIKVENHNKTSDLLLNFPEDCWIELLSFLDMKEMTILRLVSKNMQEQLDKVLQQAIRRYPDVSRKLTQYLAQSDDDSFNSLDNISLLLSARLIKPILTLYDKEKDSMPGEIITNFCFPLLVANLLLFLDISVLVILFFIRPNVINEDLRIFSMLCLLGPGSALAVALPFAPRLCVDYDVLCSPVRDCYLNRRLQAELPKWVSKEFIKTVITAKKYGEGNYTENRYNLFCAKKYGKDTEEASNDSCEEIRIIINSK